MFKRLLLSSLLLVAAVAGVKAQTLLSESFDGTTFPPTGWTVTGSGNNSNFAGQTDWVRVPPGATTAYAPYNNPVGPHSGAGMVFYNSWDIDAGGYSHLITPAMNFSTAGVKTISFWLYRNNGQVAVDSVTVFINSSASPTGATRLASYTPNNTTTNGWQQYSITVPSGFTSATQHVIFTAYSAYQTDIFLDDVLIINAPPCTGTPATPTVSASAPSLCVGEPVTLTANSGSSGITYQWKLNGVNIPGATSATYTTTVTATAQYSVTTTCTASGAAATSASVTVTAITGSFPYTQDFESITADNTLPSCMSAITLGSTVYSYITNQTNSYNQINHTTGGSKFVSFRYSSLDRYLFTPAFNMDASKTYQVSFWYITDGLGGWDTLRAVLSSSQTAAGIVATAIPVTGPNNTTYQQYTATLKPAVSGIYYFGIQVKGTGAPWYLSVDDINISELPVCGGTPTASTVTGSSVVCVNTPFSLTAGGYSNTVSGISYQWQSAPSCASGAWTNIPGATSYNYVSAGISASTAYRVITTCTTSGVSVASACFPVTIGVTAACYCTSNATNTGDTDIGQVTVGATSYPAASPTPQTSNPVANKLYTDYTTSVTPFQLTKTNTYPLSIMQFTTGSTFYSAYLKAFIDYNQNFSLTDASEQVVGIAGTSTAANPSHSSTFTVPATAQVGITLMRFVLRESGSATNTAACGTYSYGETEDYLVEISGKPLPPVVTNNGGVCAGDSVTINAKSTIITSSPANSPQYTLSGPGIATPITNATGIFRIATPTTSGTARYIVYVRAYTQNSDTAGTTVTLYSNPAITLGTVTNPTTCTGTTGSIEISGLDNSTAYTLSYNRNGVRTSQSITATGTGRYLITGLNVATYDSIRVTSAGGCRSNLLGPVALVPPTAPPTPYATANQQVCLSDTLTLTVQNPNPSGTYNWFGPNGFSATGVTVKRNNMQYADTGLYSVTVNIGGCISAPYQIRVAITAPSPAPTVTPQSFCQNTTGVALTAQGVNLLYYNDSLTGAGVPSLFPNTAVAGSNGNYFVTQNTNGCPSRPRTRIPVTIVPQPNVPAVPSANLVYCQFDKVGPLTATGAAGSTLLYYSDTTQAGVPSLIPNVSQPGTTTYYVTQTINGCRSRFVAITVRVKSKPAPPVVNSPVNVCQFSAPVQLTAVGQSLLWYDVDTGGTGLPDAPLPYTGYEDTLAYYVTQTIDGCESDRANINVIVNYNPNATFVPSKRFVCIGDTISFIYYGNAKPDAEYRWFVPSPAGTIVSGDGTQGPLVARFDSAGTYRVRLIVNNKGCISPPVYQDFEVRPRPDVRITGKREVCIGEVTELTLDSISANISSYNWTFDGGTVVYSTQNSGPYGVKWESPGVKNVVVSTVARQCGSYTHNEQIRVHEYPAARILNKPSGTVCAGDSIRLQAADLGPGYSYLWSPATAFTSYERAGTTVWATATYEGTQTRIVLKVTDSIGCAGEDAVVLQTEPCCKVAFPNAFTPNNDGRNDRFGMMTNGTPQVAAFRIFNRLGNVVFETANSLVEWDGTYKDEPQPSGVYFFYVKYRCDGKEFEQKGEVTLLR